MSHQKEKKKKSSRSTGETRANPEEGVQLDACWRVQTRLLGRVGTLGGQSRGGVSCGGLQQHGRPGARRGPRVWATGPPEQSPHSGRHPQARAAHPNGSGRERGAGGGGGLREAPGPGDAAVAAAEPGPGRARRGSGVGLARGRRRHRDTIELRFPVAAAASAAASPASASRPGTHTHIQICARFQSSVTCPRRQPMARGLWSGQWEGTGQ